MNGTGRTPYLPDSRNPVSEKICSDVKRTEQESPGEFTLASVRSEG